MLDDAYEDDVDVHNNKEIAWSKFIKYLFVLTLDWNRVYRELREAGQVLKRRRRQTLFFF